MAENVTPAVPGAIQQPPTVESRMANFLQQTEGEPETTAPESEQATPAPSVEAQQPEGQAEPDELSPDDLIAEEQAPAAQPGQPAEVFEFDAAGEKLRLPRDEVIKLAQQGHDYTRKTMALADKARAVEERLQRVTAIEQVSPQLQAAYAQAAALEQQVRQYDRVDWVALATNDPLEYSKVRAQFDVLNQTFQRAAGQYQQLRGAVGEQEKALKQQVVAAESQKLVNDPDRIQKWKDPEVFKAESRELREYLVSRGASEDEVDGLTSSLAVTIAYESMQYRKLLKAKQEKIKSLKSLPPVTRPGAGPNPSEAKAGKEQELRARIRKSGSDKDAAAWLMNRL